MSPGKERQEKVHKPGCCHVIGECLHSPDVGQYLVLVGVYNSLRVPLTDLELYVYCGGKSLLFAALII